MAQQYALIELADGNVAVCGPDYASKALFRGMGRVVFQTVAAGKAGWIVDARYRRQAEAMVARQNGTGIATTAPVRSFAPRRRYTTSSGWCEACEDGIVSQCKHGGCY